MTNTLNNFVITPCFHYISFVDLLQEKSTENWGYNRVSPLLSTTYHILNEQCVVKLSVSCAQLLLVLEKQKQYDKPFSPGHIVNWNVSVLLRECGRQILFDKRLKILKDSCKVTRLEKPLKSSHPVIWLGPNTQSHLTGECV